MRLVCAYLLACLSPPPPPSPSLQDSPAVAALCLAVVQGLALDADNKGPLLEAATPTVFALLRAHAAVVTVVQTGLAALRNLAAADANRAPLMRAVPLVLAALSGHPTEVRSMQRLHIVCVV